MGYGNEDIRKQTKEDKKFKEQHSRDLSRLHQYNENMVKSYALIWERCTIGIPTRFPTEKNGCQGHRTITLN